MLKWAFNPALRPVIDIPTISVEIPAEENDNAPKPRKPKNTSKKRVARSNTGTFSGRLGVSSLFGSFSGKNDLALKSKSVSAENLYRSVLNKGLSTDSDKSSLEGDFKQNTSIDQENNNDDESSHIGDKQNPVDNVQNNTEKEQNSNLIVDETNISNLIVATNEEDVDNEAIEKCPFCGLELGDVFLSVGGRDFHQHCFKCHICGKQIDGIFFTDENENFICPEDFKILEQQQMEELQRKLDEAPVCTSCGLKIHQELLNINDLTFHPACFICSICANPINDQYFPDGDDSFLCLDCYSRYRAVQCSVCSTGIVEGRRAELGEKSYHGRCFVCTNCNKNLVDKNVFQDDKGNLLCFDCHMKLRN